MNNFEFVSPTKIFFGKEQEKNVGKIISELGYKKVLFHYGKNSIKKSGLYDIVVKSLNEYNIKFVELGGVEPNPKIELVREGVKLSKEEHIDFILAVGGGSVIDSAKSIACGSKVDFDPWLFSIHQKTVEEALPVGVILTISAAGSELSNSCVISDQNSRIKNGFNSDLIRPKFAIMNPELTFTVSKYQTACGIVDIMMHTLERYFSDVDDLIFTDNIALAVIKTTLEAGLRVMENPYDYNARAALMITSSYSHNGLTGLGSNMYFTVHRLEHVLSGIHDEVAHGAGLSILFPAWAMYTKDFFYNKWVRFAKEVFNLEGDNAVDTAILKLKNYYKTIGMPTSLLEVGVTNQEFIDFALHASKNKTFEINGVKKIGYEDVIKILSLCE